MNVFAVAEKPCVIAETLHEPIHPERPFRKSQRYE